MERKKILVVEDERIVAEDIRESLERMGYEVVAVAASGEEALRDTDAFSPDLVLMDLHLKGEMHGTQAAKRIQEQHHTPVIFLTAYSDPESLDQAKTVGSYGYLLKPFNERELYTTIEVALHKHAMEERLRSTQAQLERRVRELEGHSRMTHFQLSMHTSQEAYSEILQVLEEVLAPERAILYLPDSGGKRLEPRATLGLAGPGRLEIEAPPESAPSLSLSQTDHLAVKAFVGRRPETDRDREAAVPLLDGRQAIGVIWIQKEGLDEETRQMLWRLAAEATLVLRGAQACEGLDQAALSLDELQDLE